MSNGNSDMTMKVLQGIALETHQIHQMVNKMGQISAQQAQMLNGMNNIMNNLTGLSMLSHCMQTALLDNMDEFSKADVMEIYERLCKENGVKPLTGEISGSDETRDEPEEERGE